MDLHAPSLAADPDGHRPAASSEQGFDKRKSSGAGVFRQAPRDPRRRERGGDRRRTEAGPRCRERLNDLRGGPAETIAE